MKKLILIFVLSNLGFLTSVTAAFPFPGVDTCNVVVINDTEEQNGVFITGTSGQKAAVDIPIASDIRMTITSIKVTLSSVDLPTYVHLRFYNDTLSTPEDPQEEPQEIPGDILFDITDCTIDTFEIVGYEPMHQFFVRNITLLLNEPIVLEGNLVQGHYWMGVLADANAWATTAHFDTGAGVVGESVTMGSNNFDWFQMINLEGLYELTAECSITIPAQNTPVNTAISIYPVPATEYITIDYPSGIPIEKIELFNSSGQKVREYTSGLNNVSLSGLREGLYILRISDNGNNITNHRIIKSSRLSQ